jgi:hypothetical protein
MKKYIQIENYELHTDKAQHGIAIFKEVSSELYGFRLTQFHEYKAERAILGAPKVGLVNSKFDLPSLEEAKKEVEGYIGNGMKFIGH